jgi:hypothetical protein
VRTKFGQEIEVVGAASSSPKKKGEHFWFAPIFEKEITI